MPYSLFDSQPAKKLASIYSSWAFNATAPPEEINKSPISTVSGSYDQWMPWRQNGVSGSWWSNEWHHSKRNKLISIWLIWAVNEMAPKRTSWLTSNEWHSSKGKQYIWSSGSWTVNDIWLTFSNDKSVVKSCWLLYRYTLLSVFRMWK